MLAYSVVHLIVEISFTSTYLFSDNRLYHFQAEDEADQKAWMAVLVNCKEKALTRAFQHANPQMSPSLVELQKAVIK